jgi:hypothetical protein
MKTYLLYILLLIATGAWSQGPWNFNGTFDGWTTANYMSATAGDSYMTLTHSEGPNVDGLAGGAGNGHIKITTANVDADNYSIIAITMKNVGTNSNRVSPVIGSDHTNHDNISTNDAEFTTYYINLSSNGSWTGTVNEIKIKFRNVTSATTNTAGSILIDKIEVLASVPAEATNVFDFNSSNLGSWDKQNYVNINNTSDSGEHYVQIQIAENPNTATGFGSNGNKFKNESAGIDADAGSYIAITMKNLTDNQRMRIVFDTNLENNNDTFINIPITANDSDFKTYLITPERTGKWSGTIDEFFLRWHPDSSHGVPHIGNVLIDKIEILPFSTVRSFNTLQTNGTTTAYSKQDITIPAGGGIEVTGELTNNDNIILVSSSSASATLKAGSTTAGTAGTYEYQKYVSATPINDLISGPFAGGGLGTFLSDNDAVLHKDSSTPVNYLFGTFDRDSGDWVNHDANDSGLIVAGRGYRAATASGSTVSFKGSTLQTTDMQTSSSGVLINTGDDPTYGSWNLVGNPFPSYLDAAHFRTDNNARFAENFKAIYAYDGDVSDGWLIIDANNASSYKIAPGQAFFVKPPSGKYLSFDVDMQTTAGTDDFIPNSYIDDSKFKLRLTDGDKRTTAGVYLYSFATACSDAGYDTGMIPFASGLTLYSKFSDSCESDVKLANQAISSDISSPVTIPIGLTSIKEGNLSIGLANPTALSILKVYVKDNQSGDVTLLNENEYTFYSGEQASYEDRFELVLNYETLDANHPALKASSLEVYSKGNTVRVNADLRDGDEVFIYDLSGRQLHGHTMKKSSTTYAFEHRGLGTGIYIAQLKRNDFKQSVKFLIK